MRLLTEPLFGNSRESELQPPCLSSRGTRFCKTAGHHLPPDAAVGIRVFDLESAGRWVPVDAFLDPDTTRWLRAGIR
jgi:hypothetical protein